MEDYLKSKETGAEDNMKDRFLTFKLDDEMFGIKIEHVMEIVGIQKTTAVPEMPYYMKGIVNLRGKMIPVMDVRLRFGKAAKEYNDRTCIIIIEMEGNSAGLIVDGVSEVLSIPGEEISDKPGVNGRGDAGYISRIGKVGDNVILLVDCETLVNT